MIPQDQTIEIGKCTLTLLNVGDLLFDMKEGLAVPAEEWRPSDRPVFKSPVVLPVQCVLVRTPDVMLLVDAGMYEPAMDAEAISSDYTPPLPLTQQLSRHAVRANQIQYVIITHAHADHYNGLTERSAEGHLKPVFPNATVILGRGDWNRDEMQRALLSQDSLEARTLGFLHEIGSLTLVDQRTEIAPGVEVVPTPGETPGHLALRIESEGSVAYCVGDLYHHVVEVEKPEWSVTWADKAKIQESRSRIFAAALEEDALLIATHIRGSGRLVSTSGGPKWEVA